MNWRLMRAGLAAGGLVTIALVADNLASFLGLLLVLFLLMAVFTRIS